MILRILTSLRRRGVTRCVLNLHHLPQTITAIVGDGSQLGLSVRYSWEQPRLLGSAGGPRHALPLVDGDPVLIVNGDTLTDVDVDALERAHVLAGASATLALVPNREFPRYGGVRLDANQRVTGFVPRGPAAEGSYHFIGVQIAQRKAIEALADNEPASTVGGVYDAWIAMRPGSVAGCLVSSEFWDVGTLADYRRMSDAFAARERRGDVICGAGGTIDPTARVTRSILWDDVEVGAGAVLDGCIVTDGVHIAPGARHQDEVLTAHEPADH